MSDSAWLDAFQTPDMTPVEAMIQARMSMQAEISRVECVYGNAYPDYDGWLKAILKQLDTEIYPVHDGVRVERDNRGYHLWVHDGGEYGDLDRMIQIGVDSAGKVAWVTNDGYYDIGIKETDDDDSV